MISSFVSGPGAGTLPMVIYSKVKLGVSPDINALASLIICAVGACVLVAGVVMRRSERRRLLELQLPPRRARRRRPQCAVLMRVQVRVRMRSVAGLTSAV